jgi:hypothetical protein
LLLKQQDKFKDRPTFIALDGQEPLTSLAAVLAVFGSSVGRTTPIGMMDPEVFNHGSVCSSLASLFDAQ